MLIKQNIFIYIIIFISSYNFCFSQESLQLVEKEYKSKTLLDSDFFEITAKYAQTLLVNHKEQESFKLLETNYNLAKKNNDLANFIYLKCIEALQFSAIGKNEKSKASFLEAKKNIEKINNLAIKGYFSYTGGWLAIRDSNEIEAVNYFLQALKHYDLLNDPKNNNRRKSVIYNELARIYGDWNDHEMHEKYTTKTLEYALLQDNQDAIFSAYMALGYLYERKLIENPNDISLRNQVEKNYTKAIDIYNNNTMLYPSDLAYAAINLAGIYIKYYPDSYKEKAKEYAQIAKEIAIENDEHNYIASVLSILAEIDYKENKIESAKEKFKEALIALENSSNKDKNVELNIIDHLIKIEIENDNFKEAIKYHNDYLAKFKEAYNSEKLEISRKLGADYEKKIQQKENEKLKIQAENREQDIQLLKLSNLKRLDDFNNLKLLKDIQEKKLALNELFTESKKQELKLSKIETESKNKDLKNYQEKLEYKELINTYYILIIIAIALILLLTLFLLRQRTIKLQVKSKIYQLDLEKEKQKTKITALKSLLSGQEKERERLARDLHDGLGGALSAIKLQISDLINTNNNDVNELKKINDHLNFAINKLRKVSHNLMPDIIIKYGLETALKEYANRMMNNNLEIDVTFLGYTKTLDVDKELFVYRIIQELVNNAIKHANPTHILIQVVEDEELYHITVEDDGIGFEIIDLDFKNSAGFINIQSRIQFLKGTFEIYSKENEGTSIEFNFPKK